LSELNRHFEEKRIEVFILCQNWIMTLFTQVIPLSQVQRFFALFFQDGWLIMYRLILVIFEKN